MCKHSQKSKEFLGGLNSLQGLQLTIWPRQTTGSVWLCLRSNTFDHPLLTSINKLAPSISSIAHIADNAKAAPKKQKKKNAKSIR
jgi:hypothetical protein